MKNRPKRTIAALVMTGALVATLTSTATAGGKKKTLADAPAPVPVALDQFFDNDGFSPASAKDGDFDGTGRTYPAEGLPGAGETVVNGVPYLFPSSAAGAKNNVVAMGQTIPLPKKRYHTAHFLLAASTPMPTAGVAGGPATVHYADGSTSSAELAMGDWLNAGGVINVPHEYGPDGNPTTDPASIFTTNVWLDPSKEAVSVTLPTTSPVGPENSSLHVFSMSVQPAVSGAAVRVSNARSTTKVMPDNNRLQSFEATVTNVGDRWITERNRAFAYAIAPGAVTVEPARIHRLAPGEEIRVRIGVLSRAEGKQVNGAVRVDGFGVHGSQASEFTLGVPDYEATDESLGKHQSPYWYDDAKFGYFVMYGPYSIPAYAPNGRFWAEWYQALMTDGPALMGDTDVYDHHKATYGEDFNYDDFIKEFDASEFDPKEWVELFEDGGAKYYVFSAKQHDGFSMWDTQYSDRDSVAMGPKRDFVKELADAASEHTPDLHSGAYFSMQEWYNPDQPWVGHGPQNPYTGESLPYTGYEPGKDFVKDYQGPQMRELIDKYDNVDMLWCDILGPNESRQAQADIYNTAKREGRQIAINDQCSIPTNDFTTTPQMMYGNTVVKKWERSQTLEPLSYGYNQTTPDDQYKSPNEVVDMLTDVVSKNGNLLLTAPPQGDGTFPEVVQSRMKAVGKWLETNGEAIYGTTYWSRMPQLGNLRFTVKPNEAFYVTSLEAPEDKVVIDAPVPVRPGDKVTMLGYSGGPLKWTQSNGKLTIEVPAAARDAGEYAWTFKISR